MPRLPSPPRPRAASDRSIERLLHAWIVAGLAIWLLLPVEAWHNPTIGWLPYWLLVAPTISLGLLRRQRLAAALSAFLVRGRRRRKPAARRRVARPTPATQPRLRHAAAAAPALIGR